MHFENFGILKGEFMKKIFAVFILPIVALLCLCGCGEERKSEDVKTLYENTKQVCIVDNDNKFFSDETKPDSIVIKYSDDVSALIYNVSPSSKLSKKYAVIGYQQKILNNIFNYYEKNKENFYLKMSSANFDKNEMNDLYSSLESLKSQLETFKNSYNTFTDATKGGVNDVMEFNLTNYSFDLNQLIQKSFDFIYKFIDLNEKYCLENLDIVSIDSLESKIQKTYVDIAYIVYLNNFKAFDYSVGSKGISDDLDSIIGNTSEFLITKDLEDYKSLSVKIRTGLDAENADYANTMNLVNNYLYAIDVFNQRLSTYKSTYFEEDIYKITQYKFGLVIGVDYESYCTSLTKSRQASLRFMDDFVLNVYGRLVDTLGTIIND